MAGLFVLLALAFTPLALSAQQEGVVTGQVLSADTNRPLAGAQVFVQGTSLGALTDPGGEFSIANVPSGDAVVRAQLIGYRPEERTVAVTADETVAVDFALSESAVALDEVVVTGTAGATRRRAVGTSLASINAEALTEAAPITNFDQLLQGREPGMVGVGASGTVGAASSLNLRGITSLTQGTQPLIYIDGVRMESGRGMVSSGEATTRLNELNVQDIARIEVIKGAAATTLYGSEASNGVIQIFTKRGTGSEPAYNLGVRLGATQTPPNFPRMHPDPQYPAVNDLLKTGLYQEHNLSVRGLSGPVNYYLSGSYTDSEGTIPGNYLSRASGRLNIGLDPSDRLSIDFSSNFVSSRTGALILDNVTTSVLGNIMMGNPVTAGTEEDPWGGAFMPIDHVLRQERNEEVYRFIGGVTADHQLGERIRQRMTVGLDFADGTQTLAWPFAPDLDFPRSSRSVNRNDNLRTNVDYAATWTANPSPAIESQLSVGGQLATRRTRSLVGSGQDFAAPGLSLIGGTAVRNVTESELSYTTGGIFLQEQLGFNDRLYLTGGVRVDGSSVFGDDFGWQPYPKVSASYVISDEGWFNVPAVSSLRLRTGYGLAGMQPGAFDAQRTYTPFTAVDGQVAIGQSTIGNPNLAPEVSREWEGGFDAGLFDDRMTVEASFYAQTTSDALLSRSYPASSGFTANQIENVGEVANQGLELLLSGELFQRGRVSLNATATYAHNRSEVRDMGELGPIEVDRFGTRIVEGFPVSSKWGVVSVGAEADGSPIPSDSALYLGPGFPPHNGSLRLDAGIGDLTLFANTQWAAGHQVTYLGRVFMITRATGEEYYRTLMDSNDDPEAPAVRNLVGLANCCVGEFTERGDWMKLREVGVAYALPPGFPGGGVQTQLSLSGRNLFTLTGYSGTDPEIAAQFGNDDTGLSVSSEFFSMPQPRQFILGVNVAF